MRRDAHTYPWVVLGVATLAQSSTAFVFLGVGTLAGFIQDAYNLSGVRIGLLFTAIGLVPMFALLPVGRLLDRYGERGVVAAGALLLAAGTGAAATVGSYPLLLGALLIGGAGYASSQPGGSKAVAGWFDVRRRGVAMGIRQTGLPLGGALAAAVLPAVAVAVGWRSAMAVAAAVAACGGLAFAGIYRAHGSHRVGRYRMRDRLPSILAQRDIRPVLWAGVAMVSAQFAAISYLMLFLRDVHAIPLARGAWYLSGAQLAGVAGRVLLASWSDRFGPGQRLRPVVVATATTALATAVLPLVPTGAGGLALVPLTAVFGFFGFGWYGPWVVHVAEAGDDDTVGLTLGVAMTANQVGIVAAPPLFGLLFDATGGYLLPWLAVAALLAATTVRISVAARHGHA